jgi:hypothetical protein
MFQIFKFSKVFYHMQVGCNVHIKHVVMIQELNPKVINIFWYNFSKQNVKFGKISRLQIFHIYSTMTNTKYVIY